MKYIALIVPVLLLTGCGDEVSKVKDGLIDNNQAYKNGLILDNRNVCQDTQWKAYEKEGIKYVKYTCLLKPGKIFSVYSKEEEEKRVNAKSEELANAFKTKQETYLNNIQEAIDESLAYINRFNELSTSERENISIFSIEGIHLENIISEYAQTSEGKEAFKALSILHTGFSLKSPVANFNVKIRSLDPETQYVINRILTDVTPLYIERVKAEAKKVSADMVNEYTAGTDKVISEMIDLYQETHPVSRTETVIWTWNKLDKRYERIQQYFEQEWVNGEKNKDSLCLENVVYSVTHNVTTPDDYYDERNVEGRCSY